MTLMKTIRWGILGPGSIAHQFAAGIQLAPNAVLGAAGSRDKAKAQAYCEKFGGGTAHGSYEALVADPDVDAIYVATPHDFHCEHSLLALEAGKPVLCEKPVAINASQARKIVAKAEEKGLFFMEGMWTRFFPVMARVRAWVREGRIGEVLTITADFGFRASFNPTSRLFDPARGGGALLDVGIYPVSFASMLMGKPERIASAMVPAENGVDAQSAAILIKGHTMAVLYTAVEATTPWEAVVIGEKGRITVATPFWKPSIAVLKEGDNEPEIFESPFEGPGFQYEVEEASRLIAEGCTQSDIMPHAESIAIMETMDAMRAQWGLRYPME